MNSTQRKKLAMLKRRMNFLENRLHAEKEKDLTFDRAEWSALKFAVNCVQLAEENNLITKKVGASSLVEKP